MPNIEYNNTLGISSSMIKDFRKMPPSDFKKIWITKEVESKQSAPLTRGNLVDDLLFNPKVIEDKYLITEVQKPSDAIAFIIERIFTDKEDLSQAFKERIKESAKIVPMLDGKIGYGQSWKEETLFEKVLKEGTEYYNFLKSVNGKCVVSSKDYMEALMMVEKVKANEFCKPYLDPEYNQFQFQIETQEDFPEKMKGCLDIFHKHDKRQEIQNVDFKTAESAYYFEINVRKFGYLDQVAFYDRLIGYWMNVLNPEFIAYTMLPPLNIVIDRTHMIPYIYEYSPKDIEAAWEGYYKYGKWQKGLKDWIAEIQWHVVNDFWDFPMEMYLNGSIKLDLISHYDK